MLPKRPAGFHPFPSVEDNHPHFFIYFLKCISVIQQEPYKFQSPNLLSAITHLLPEETLVSVVATEFHSNWRLCQGFLTNMLKGKKFLYSLLSVSLPSSLIFPNSKPAFHSLKVFHLPNCE